MRSPRASGCCWPSRPKAALSDYVRQEWQFALQADKAVTPILRQGDYPLVPAELKLLHCEDFPDDAHGRNGLFKAKPVQHSRRVLSHPWPTQYSAGDFATSANWQ